MSAYKKIPCDKTIDNSLLLLLEGYSFIQNRCYKYKTDIFQTRLLGQKAICMTGEEAAKVFYDNNYFKRKEVAPKRVQKTLTGQNGVQGLDGKAHINRKQMFMSIMTHENVKVLIDYTTEQWEKSSVSWQNKDIVLFDEAQIIMCQVACRWAGVPLQHNEIKQRASDLGKMIDGFGGVGLRYRQGRCARKRSEEWIRDIITKIRARKFTPAKGTAADTIAWQIDQNKKLLSTQIAAVELLNIIRPMVAIATYITFGVLAMYEEPEYRNKFQRRDNDYNQMFVQEVRRFYPFTPYVAAQAKKSFTWKQYYITKGTLVLLDIYGTNHDPRLWMDPYEFIPERFDHWEYNAFSFMPQGGGDCNNGHRCAGELVTTEVMKASLDFIVNQLTYKVPKQNLRYRLSRIPTLPKSRFKMSKVRRII
jgi:fatty-acid peroxygenase